jgi:hypothetical protein
MSGSSKAEMSYPLAKAGMLAVFRLSETKAMNPNTPEVCAAEQSQTQKTGKVHLADVRAVPDLPSSRIKTDAWETLAVARHCHSSGSEPGGCRLRRGGTGRL